MAYTQKGYDAGEGTGTSKSGLPSGFYKSFENAAPTNKDGKKLNMGQTKAASTKSGTFTPVYT